MKSKFTPFLLITLFMLLAVLSASAKIYTVSKTSAFSITPSGNDTITGSGTHEIEIKSDVPNAVYTITLKDMSLVANMWASAISINNNDTTGTTMTINFMIDGVNKTSGHNHPGIQVSTGNVNVVFTSLKGGSLLSESRVENTPSWRADAGATFNASIASNLPSNIVASATLEGNSVIVEDAFSTTAAKNAFNSKPLVLTFTDLTVGVKANKPLLKLSAYTTIDGLVVDGLKTGESYRVYDITGNVVVHSHAKSSKEMIRLPHGIYVIKTNSAIIKVVN